MEIIPFNKNFENDLIRISDENFGENYISKIDLENKANLLFVLTLKQKAIGFIIIKILTIQELIQLVLKEKEWFKKEYYTTDKVVIFHQMAIDKNYQNCGYGSQLVKFILDRFSYEIYFCFVWNKENNLFTSITRGALLI